MSNAQGQAPRSRGRPKVTPDAEQRVSIIRAARELFSTRGYGGTTMDDVATICRVSKRTLYRLFAAKSDLCAAVIQDHAYEMLALPGNYDGLPLEAALATIFRIDISEEEEMQRLGLLMMLVPEAARFPEITEILEQHGVDRQRRLLGQWLKDRGDRDGLNISTGLSEARMLMDIVFGARALKSSPTSDRMEADERRRHQRLAIAIFCRGITR